MDTSFISQIYERYYHSVSVFIKSALYSNDPGDAANCVSEVFVIAMQKNGLENHPNILGWLFKTSSYVAKNFNRKYMDKRNYTCRINEAILIEDNSMTHEAELRDLRKRIENSLSENEREFYNLYYIRQLDVKTISNILGISESAVYTRNSRLRAKIKALKKGGEPI